MKKIDVCIPTLNSENTLSFCLKAIKESIPFNRIIICDGYSTDGTVKIAKKYGCEIHYSKGRLAEVRSKLIKLAKTEWIAFIDSDIVVNKKWFNYLVRNIREEVGAIHGFGLPKNLLLRFLRASIFKLKKLVGIKQRGFTSNTLIRKEAVEGIKLPKNIHRTEDKTLKEEIEKRGWKWVYVPVFCTHLKSSTQLLREALKDFNIYRKSGINPIKILTEL